MEIAPICYSPPNDDCPGLGEKQTGLKEANRINPEGDEFFQGIEVGLILQQVCDLSGVEKEGRHSERTAAVVGKWPPSATLPIVPQCGSIASCWCFPRMFRTHICIPRAGRSLKNCFHVSWSDNYIHGGTLTCVCSETNAWQVQHALH